jgi:hypothetical protein
MSSRPVALVTGASSGIGLALARVLALEGHDLVLVARREAELQRLASDLSGWQSTESVVVPADLSTPDGAAEVARRVADAGLDIDVLVNNAGFGLQGSFADQPVEELQRMLAVNVVTLTELTRLVLPGMVARRHGRVLNVASTAAFQPGPFMAVYYASKAYVLSFTEAIAEELSGTGVTATALCPGAVPSGFQERAQFGEHSPLMRTPGVKSAEVVARAAYDGMVRGRRIVIPGSANKLGAQSIRFAPRRVVTKVVRRLHPQT